jgi:hypothetical protein
VLPSPFSVASPDRGFRRCAAVRLAGRGGQPVAVGVCFARPRITGISQSPPPCVGAPLSYVNHAARTCRKRPYGQTSNIIGLSLINLGTWATVRARHRLGIGARNHQMSPPSVAKLLRWEPATIDPV